MANLEDQPPLNTSIIGIRPDGTVWAYQPNAPGGMVQVGAGPEPGPLSLGTPVAMTEGEIITPAGVYVFASGDAASVIDADGTTTAAPSDGNAYPVE